MYDWKLCTMQLSIRASWLTPGQSTGLQSPWPTPGRASLFILNTLKTFSHTFFSHFVHLPVPLLANFTVNLNSIVLILHLWKNGRLRAKQGLPHSSVLILHPTVLTPAKKAPKSCTHNSSHSSCLFYCLVFPLFNEKITLHFYHPSTWSLFRQDQNRQRVRTRCFSTTSCDSF